MVGLGKIVRIIALGAVAVAVVPVVGDLFVRLVWFDHSQLEGLRSVPGRLIAQSWFWPVFMLILGGAGGLWADFIMRRGERTERIATLDLGLRLTQLSDQLVRYQEDRHTQVPPAEADIQAALVRLTKRKISVPETEGLTDEERLKTLATHFRWVGTYLANSQVAEARSWSSSNREGW